MKYAEFKIILCMLLLITPSMAHSYPTAKVTYKVISDMEEPIEGVKVRAGFRSYSTSPTVYEGFTEKEGLFTTSGSTQYEVVASFSKQGYYNSGNTYGGNDFTGISGITGFRHWEPWNSTITVRLKKIKNPIALYMRDVGSKSIYKGIEENPSSFLIVVDKYLGFDLVVSDWVAPYGLGTHPDFLFKLEKRYKAPDDFRHVLTLKFSNLGDGIQPYYTEINNASIFKMPYHAPIDGYKNELIQLHESIPNKIYKKTFRTDQNYYFRVRTELDKKGNVISALYGKIEGNIEFPSGTEKPLARLLYKYYLNPTPNDTNLEFDETKNLFSEKNAH